MLPMCLVPTGMRKAVTELMQSAKVTHAMMKERAAVIVFAIYCAIFKQIVFKVAIAALVLYFLI